MVIIKKIFQSKLNNALEYNYGTALNSKRSFSIMGRFWFWTSSIVPPLLPPKSIIPLALPLFKWPMTSIYHRKKLGKRDATRRRSKPGQNPYWALAVKLDTRYCMLCSYSIQYINFFFAIFLKEEKILFHHNSTPLIITLLCVCVCSLLNKLIRTSLY